MKPAASIVMWAIVVRSKRTEWINWSTIRSTRKEAIQAYSEAYLDKEAGISWYKKGVRLKTLRPCKILISTLKP